MVATKPTQQPTSTRQLGRTGDYDRTAQDAPLPPGERALVLDQRIQGKGKLSDRWESQPHVVTRPYPDLPVYTVCPEAGPEHVLRRKNP